MAIFWKNVGVDVQTALASAITINAISKANPGVVTYTGTDPSNGDYVLVAATGMTELNDRVFRVANVNGAANTFELEGENTTDYGTFVSGSFQVITFGASFNILQTFDVSGGDPEYADTTTIHDSIRKRAPTVVSPMSITSNAIFDPSDAGYIEANRAYKAQTKRAFKLRFGTTAKMCFNGFVSAPGTPRGQAQGVVQTALAIEVQNYPSFWST
ncbi:MAG TPA: phage tail tube protein [Candidatus Limnocylindrales bacterium]|nr:phage tail tube protein [Candidatus Limnocylindrales bacterium]